MQEINENIDKLESELKKPEKSRDELKQYQLILSKSYINVLLAISKNRTDDIKQKFYQYRILEFFCREIDLEFDVDSPLIS